MQNWFVCISGRQYCYTLELGERVYFRNHTMLWPLNIVIWLLCLPGLPLFSKHDSNTLHENNESAKKGVIKPYPQKHPPAMLTGKTKIIFNIPRD